MKKQLQSTLYLLSAIPDLSELTMCPSVFSGDFIKHDCDACPAFAKNAGDLYDENVCRSCWTQAITESFKPTEQ